MTRRHLIAASLALATLATTLPSVVGHAAPTRDVATTALLDYLRERNTTGFLVVRDGRTVIEHNWPAPAEPQFRMFAYGQTRDGALLEDVASQQKSFVAVLFAIARDRGVIDFAKPVSAYLGPGWSKATQAQEAAITVDHLLQMNSGLDERFGYVAPAGSVFLYNTPVYAVTKRILTAATGRTLDAVTRDGLTGPAGMADTDWRTRPGAMASVGNNTGLVTSPRDIARFGRMVLAGGVAPGGRRVVSAASLRTLFERSATNPAYGRLWWLNGGAYAMRAATGRRDGPLIAAAPADLVAALGAFDRRLYIVPSQRLVVVRTGAATADQDFDQQLWLRLRKVIG